VIKKRSAKFANTNGILGLINQSVALHVNLEGGINNGILRLYVGYYDGNWFNGFCFK